MGKLARQPAGTIRFGILIAFLIVSLAFWASLDLFGWAHFQIVSLIQLALALGAGYASGRQNAKENQILAIVSDAALYTMAALFLNYLMIYQTDRSIRELPLVMWFNIYIYLTGLLIFTFGKIAFDLVNKYLR